jgi:hypothetical protein
MSASMSQGSALSWLRRIMADPTAPALQNVARDKIDAAAISQPEAPVLPRPIILRSARTAASIQRFNLPTAVSPDAP